MDSQSTLGDRSAVGARALSRGGRLAALLAILWAVLAVLTLAPGALTLDTHAGDATHLAALVLRVAGGEVPHLDIMTPIGIGAIWPIAVFVQMGVGLGLAYLLAQATLAAALLPALWWVGMTRFGGGWMALAFGALVLVLAMALVHGGTGAHLSVSMHYNRWAWAVALVLLALVLMPPARPAPRVEGVMLGLGLAVLALVKVTYLVALAPVVLLALALRGERATLGWGILSGLALVGAVTLALGWGFWGAYLGDLVAVATSRSRPDPGVPLGTFLFGWDHAVPHLLLLAGVGVLFATARRVEAALLLVAAPGLMLITWQNFGNDPVWLPLLALILLALAPRDPRALALACAAGVLALPMVATLAASPLRLGAAGPGAPLIRAVAGHDDIRLAEALMAPGYWATPSPLNEGGQTPGFWGGALPGCKQLGNGMPGYAAMAAEVAEAGFAGRPALVADILQPLWLFAEFPILPRSGPWAYDGLPGVEGAEIMVVPLCPMNLLARQSALAALEGTGRPVAEVHRGPLALVLEIGR